MLRGIVCGTETQNQAETQRKGKLFITTFGFFLMGPQCWRSDCHVPIFNSKWWNPNRGDSDDVHLLLVPKGDLPEIGCIFYLAVSRTVDGRQWMRRLPEDVKIRATSLLLNRMVTKRQEWDSWTNNFFLFTSQNKKWRVGCHTGCPWLSLWLGNFSSGLMYCCVGIRIAERILIHDAGSGQIISHPSGSQWKSEFIWDQGLRAKTRWFELSCDDCFVINSAV